MIPFFGWTPEMAAAYAASVGEAQPEPVDCELCGEKVEQNYVELEPLPPSYVKRKFHLECLNKHLAENVDNQQDEITAYLLRKPLPCSSETPNSN